jgi:exodeoxyribonuclease VII large subunit
MEILTVAELTDYLKGVFDGDPLLADVWVEGEVSNCRPAASGHWYWTLKDGDASLRCVMWRTQVMSQASLPEDGRSFLLHGAVSVYPAGGQYQLYVDHCEAVGLGDLYQRFEQLKARLAAEGLFELERKRPLPAYPRRIGVVTSPDAAALRDVCKVLTRRWPAAEVWVAPAPVQGEGAPARLVAALAAIGRSGADVVILTRGGGSIEDLWAFNDEALARAIAACPVPVISGVGHETDVTIADFVADLRAPTPSAAAELATPDARELAQAVDEMQERLGRGLMWRLEGATQGLTLLTHRLGHGSPQRRIGELAARVAADRARLDRALAARVRLFRADLDGQLRRLGALSPQATLARGYAHVSRQQDGRAVRSTRDVSAGAGLTVRVTDGAFEAVVAGQAAMFGGEERG